MRILILFFAVFFIAQYVCAQDVADDGVVQDSVRIGILDRLHVERDPVLDKMLEWHIEKNHEKEGMDGFRVEIFFSSRMDAKEQALKTKVNFLSEYPDYAVHIKFVAPNFRVRVGDFRTKDEALKLYKMIQKEYPTAFVVPDVINFPLLKPN